jgi:hypothetical protein
VGSGTPGPHQIQAEHREAGNGTCARSFHSAGNERGSEAMYLGIGGLILLIIVLIILFR